MTDRGQATTIELGMKVSVRRSGQNRIGVVTRLAGDYAGIRWINWILWRPRSIRRTAMT